LLEIEKTEWEGKEKRALQMVTAANGKASIVMMYMYLYYSPKLKLYCRL